MSSLITVFDTSVCAYNVGNEIIMDAVNHVVDEVFPDRHVVKVPCTDIKKQSRYYNYASELSLVGGTNILRSSIQADDQWDLCFHNVWRLKKVVLLGCGWFQYEEKNMPWYARWAYRRILSSRYIHSVRDSYTQRKLEAIGIRSINTGCPTLWGISDVVSERIPVTPRNKVVFTITDYNKDPERDLQMLRVCEKVYHGLICFPQGTGDYDYIRALGYGDKVEFINPRLSAYDELLKSGTVDYVGTRLHAGVRALQHSVRSFILGIDNRAVEMGKDFKLPVVTLDAMSTLQTLVQNPYQCKLCLPLDKINAWKGQFK